MPWIICLFLCAVCASGHATVAIDWPVGFNWPTNAPSFNITDDEAGNITNDLDMSSFLMTTYNNILVSPAGDDSNDGTTFPKRTFKACIDLIYQNSWTNARITAAAGVYTGGILTNDAFVIPRVLSNSFRLEIICPSGEALVTTGQTGGGKVRKRFPNHTPGAVYDRKYRTAKGAPMRLTQVQTIVGIYPGQWYQCGADTIVVPIDNRDLDDDIVTVAPTGEVHSCLSHLYRVFMRNIALYGGDRTFETYALTSGRFDVVVVCDNCEFVGSVGVPDSGANNFSMSAQKDFAWLRNCRTFWSTDDGFNYSGATYLGRTPCVLEEYCVTEYCGTGSSDQSSTAHSEVIAVSIVPTYGWGHEGIVVDVGDTQRWIVRGILGPPNGTALAIYVLADSYHWYDGVDFTGFSVGATNVSGEVGTAIRYHNCPALNAHALGIFEAY